MVVSLETNDLSKLIILLQENGCEHIRFGTSLQELAIKQMVEEYMENEYDDDLAETIVDYIINHDIFETDIPNIIEEMVNEHVAEQEYDEQEYIDYVVSETEVQFWNWNKKCFDESHTAFSYEKHVNDFYHIQTEREHIQDVCSCGDDRYLATIIDGDSSSDPFVFAPGSRVVNRQGYVVYKADTPLEKEYWI